MVGAALRVHGGPRAVFSRALLLFDLAEASEEDGGRDPLSAVLLAGLGRVAFPRYSVCRTARIFQDRDDLIRSGPVSGWGRREFLGILKCWPLRFAGRSGHRSPQPERWFCSFILLPPVCTFLRRRGDVLGYWGVGAELRTFSLASVPKRLRQEAFLSMSLAWTRQKVGAFLGTLQVRQIPARVLTRTCARHTFSPVCLGAWIQ